MKEWHFWSAVAVLGGLALGFHAYIAAQSSSGPGLFELGLVAWSCLPYAVAGGLALFTRNPCVALAGALPALMVDVMAYYTGVLHPTSSTSSLALLWAPAWNLLGVVPMGAIAASLLLKPKFGDAAFKGAPSATDPARA